MREYIFLIEGICICKVKEKRWCGIQKLPTCQSLVREIRKGDIQRKRERIGYRKSERARRYKAERERERERERDQMNIEKRKAGRKT